MRYELGGKTGGRVTELPRNRPTIGLLRGNTNQSKESSALAMWLPFWAWQTSDSLSSNKLHDSHPILYLTEKPYHTSNAETGFSLRQSTISLVS
jgi:hypothetical protein